MDQDEQKDIDLPPSGIWIALRDSLRWRPVRRWRVFFLGMVRSPTRLVPESALLMRLAAESTYIHYTVNVGRIVNGILQASPIKHYWALM